MRVITGTAKGRVLNTPKGLSTRPTSDRVKEGIFSIIQFEIEGRCVLDLFAGSGQLGIEALSRGAARAVFVDQGAEPLSIIRENIEKTGFSDRAEVRKADYLAYLSSAREQFDLIFLDPPYAEKFLENAIKCISEIDILRQGGIIICEKPADKVLDGDYQGLIRQKEYRYGRTSVVLYRKG